MSLSARRICLRFILFGGLGLIFEVCFGAVWGLKNGDWNLRGSSSLWMIFDYGLLGVALLPIARPLIRRKIPLPLRAVVYMAGFFTVEFVSGWLFERCGLHIWSYRSLPYNLCGYIALMYVPIWYGVGLVAEYLYRKIDAFALVLAAGLDAPEIESVQNRQNS
ncbi:MAG: hypothetical protein BWY71_01099 [Planctomycetes bacterium ADurb.Bin412]|nr:MAG: hypothetical protein BWY71_01099 [Planctomycetes bacterium ADurb.Bin412]